MSGGRRSALPALPLHCHMPIALPLEELRSWIRLSLEPDLGPAQARHLLAAAGLPHAIYALSPGALGKLVPAELAGQLKREPEEVMQRAIDDTVRWLEHPAHHLLTLADPTYPQSLFDTHDPPIVLYVNGDPFCLSRPTIAMVGARSATAGGMDNARSFARHLAGQGWCIVSGLAQGIDTAAHEGALHAGPQGGGTVAVLGTGIDIVYPAKNRELAHQVAAQGALVSEFPLGTRALPYHFPRRNRVVAGLARGVLVVEAAKQSGSLITARLASEMGREVFAIPGSIHSPLSRGCHALIRQGAKLVESAEDILEELRRPGLRVVSRADQASLLDQAQSSCGGSGSAPGASPIAVPPATPTAAAACQPRTAVSPTQELILNALGFDPVHLDVVQQRSGLDLPTLTGGLLELELSDRVTRHGDGRFQRRHHKDG